MKIYYIILLSLLFVNLILSSILLYNTKESYSSPPCQECRRWNTYNCGTNMCTTCTYGSNCSSITPLESEDIIDTSNMISSSGIIYRPDTL